MDNPSIQTRPKILDIDPWLEPFEEVIKGRIECCNRWINKFEQNENNLRSFVQSYKRFGFNKNSEGITYVEYAPNAVEASLVGDFNNWDINKHKMEKDAFGKFSILLKNNQDGTPLIKHGSKVKISLLTKQGESLYRLPVWIKRVVQDLNISPTYEAVYWDPPLEYKWKNKRPLDKLKKMKNGALKVYEAHVGISSSEPRVCSYLEFTKNVLPRIKDLGYDAVQLMAIMEHAYYASFGYQVTSMFAISSRFGTPEEFKELVDSAHALGLIVLLDVVHSHACNNVEDGMNMFDGTDHLYFHSGPKGKHELWNSRLFDYSNYETLRLLLSNLAFYIEEYNLDGFRFDGVTSIMYKHHGIGFGFSGDYNEYFNNDLADNDGITYLMLANKILRSLYPFILTIAEDVSGMPGLARPTDEGGIGFDYKLAMAVPDMWIKILKEKTDDEWDMGNIVHTLTNRRHKEKSIAYCESHDQALVGDKSIAFWLMDKEMYTNMSDLTPLTITIDRGIALHKMIRLITHSLGGEGYLNFEGNEFGHPEWLDFPREGNSNSFHYCKRQWNLPDDHLLRYKYLNLFDREMNNKEKEYNWLSASQAYVSLKHEDDKIIVFERNNLIFIFNFHHTKSFENYKVGVDNDGKYAIIINSDDTKFGGHNRVDNDSQYFTQDAPWDNRRCSIMVYIPSRCALVLALS